MAFDEINEATLAAYFERLDPLVKPGTVLFVSGGAALYGMRTFIDNVRSRLGRPKLAVREIPAYLLADVALPGYHMPVKGEAAG